MMPRAERDLADVFAYTDAANSEAARSWFSMLKHAIVSLSRNPNRCPKTPENGNLRHHLFGTGRNVYRIIYTVSASQRGVAILHIRHGMRREFASDNFE